MPWSVLAILAICFIGGLLMTFDVPGAWAVTTAVLLTISVLAARRQQRRRD